MQEFFIMIGLSVVLAVAAFADVPKSDLTSVTRENTRRAKPFVPGSGTATFTFTNTSTNTSTTSSGVNFDTRLPSGTGTSIPQSPPKMPEEPAKPNGFK